MIPARLFHYTSIKTLLAILECRCFRFSRLDTMNDPNEGAHPALTSLRKNVFSSSWTSTEDDFIPMWKMYGDLKGIRISMPINMFSADGKMCVDKSKSNYWHLVCSTDATFTGQLSKEILSLDAERKITELYETNVIYGPTKIEYSDDFSRLENSVIKKDLKVTDFDLLEIDMNSVGLLKPLAWAFENEYRYRIVFPKASFIAGSIELHARSQLFPQQKFIDVPINNESISKMKILTGPSVSDEDFAILTKKVNSVASDIIITRSTIKIRETKGGWKKDCDPV